MAQKTAVLTQEQKAQTALFFREIYNTELKGGGAILDNADFTCQSIRRSVSGMIAQARRNICDSGVSYASANIFKPSRDGFFRRTSGFLWRFNHIAIDIDYLGDFAHDYNDLEMRLEENIYWFAESYGIPKPNFIICSGSGGIHLYYLFESLPNGADRQMEQGIHATKMKLISRWVEAENGLVPESPGFRVDTTATDSSRVFRVPGSIHERTGRMCRMIKTGMPKYKYKELCAAIEDRPWYGPYAVMNSSRDIDRCRNGYSKRINKPATGYVMTSQWLGIKRLNELLSLAKSGWGFMNCREKSSHLAWIWARDAGFSVSECEDKLRRLNEMFYAPLSERELLRTAKGNGKSYCYTNERIRSELGLSASDGFFVGGRSREFKDRKRKTRRHKKLIAALVLVGKKITEIAKELCLSVSIIKRRRTEMKKAEGFSFWASAQI